MDPYVRRVLDKWFQGKIDLKEAAEMLDTTEEIIDQLIDAYDYIPTSEEVIKACEAIEQSVKYMEKSIHKT